MAICPACHRTGRRLNPALRVDESIFGKRIHNPNRLPLLIPCTECINGEVSCCDAAGSAQPDPQPELSLANPEPRRK